MIRRAARASHPIGGLVLALLAWPHAASACAVCFSGSDESRQAYLLTALGLSILPLIMVGGFLAWLRLRSRRAASELDADAAAGEPASRPS